MKSKVYELYHCKYKGEVVYVGQGVRGSHRHCNSGTSHVFELNKIYFTEGAEALSVEVLMQDSNKGVVVKAEKEYILARKPRFNKVLNNKVGRFKNVNDSITLRKMLLDVGEKHLSKKTLEKYDSLVSEMVDYFGYASIINGNYVIEGKGIYQRLGKHNLRVLARWIRSSKEVTSNQNSHYYLLQQTLLDCFNYDILYKTT